MKHVVRCPLSYFVFHSKCASNRFWFLRVRSPHAIWSSGSQMLPLPLFLPQWWFHITSLTHSPFRKRILDIPFHDSIFTHKAILVRIKDGWKTSSSHCYIDVFLQHFSLSNITFWVGWKRENLSTFDVFSNGLLLSSEYSWIKFFPPNWITGLREGVFRSTHWHGLKKHQTDDS